MLHLQKKLGRVPGRPRGQTVRRSPLSIERLDQRLALTGISAAVTSVLQVTAVVPIPNSLTQSAPQTDPSESPAFAVHFNRPVNLARPVGNHFELDHVNPDGSSTHVAKLDGAYRETGDGSDTLMVSFTSAVDPGRYRLVLVGGNSLTDRNGVGTGQINQVIEEFAVGQQAADDSSIAAQKLIGVTGSTTSFTVPVVANDLNQTLNELDLPAGSHWKLDPQFGSADPDGYQMALYDAQKQLILSTRGSEIATVTQSLTSGTYFVEFYRIAPSADDQGSSLSVTLSGTAIKTTLPRVVAITPTNSNGLGGNPDSVLIQFDRPDLDLSLLSSSSAAFSLTDAAGQTWPITPSGYDPGTGRLLLAFSSNLPTGHYAIQALLPSATAGATQTTQTLGSFNTTLRATVPGLLGTVYPGSTADDWKNLTTLQPGQTVIERFSVIEGQDYRVNVSNPNLTGQLIQLSSSDGSAVSNQRINISLGGNTSLMPGVYAVIVTNPTAQVQSVAFSVVATALSPESLSNTGVGQLPAGLHQAVGGSSVSAAAMSQNLAPESVAAPNSIAALPITTNDRGLDSTHSQTSGTESSGAFNIASFNQIPLGSFASTESPSTTRSVPATTDALASMNQDAINSLYAIQVSKLPSFKPVPSNHPSRLQTERIQPTRPVPSPVTDPTATLAEQSPVVAGTSPPILTAAAEVEVEVVTELTTTAEPAAHLAESDPARSMILRNLARSQLAESESSDVPNVLAEMSTPVGILVASCMLYRRIKVSRYGVSLPDHDLVAGWWRNGIARLGRLRLRHQG